MRTLWLCFHHVKYYRVLFFPKSRTHTFLKGYFGRGLERINVFSIHFHRKEDLSFECFEWRAQYFRERDRPRSPSKYTQRQKVGNASRATQSEGQRRWKSGRVAARGKMWKAGECKSEAGRKTERNVDVVVVQTFSERPSLPKTNLSTFLRISASLRSTWLILSKMIVWPHWLFLFLFVVVVLPGFQHDDEWSRSR